MKIQCRECGKEFEPKDIITFGGNVRDSKEIKMCKDCYWDMD